MLVVSTSVSVYVSLSKVVWGSVVLTMGVRNSTVVVRLRSVVRSSVESICGTREENFVNNVDDTVARDDVLAEGFLVSSGGFVLVDIEDEVILRGEFRSSEDVVWNSNGGLEAVHHVTRSKLLTASSANTSSLGSLSVSLALVGVDGAVGLSTSEVTGQTSLWKNVKFQKSLFVDSAKDSVNLGEGGVGRSEDGVGRVTSRHEGQDIRLLVDEITENSEIVTNTGIDVGVSGGITSGGGTGAKVTISTSGGTTSASSETGLGGTSTNITGQFTSVEADVSLSRDSRSGKKSSKDCGEGRALEDSHVEY